MTESVPLLLGLDLGTTAVKGFLCDIAGRKIAAADEPVTLRRPEPDCVEQDMAGLWQAIVRVTRRIAAQMPPDHGLAALSLSTASGNTILLDANGQPLCPAIHWMDSRAEPELAELLPEVDLTEHYRITGWTFSGMAPLGHLAWLRRHEPALLAAAHRFCMTNDLILHRLCGHYAMDPSDASTTGFYDQLGNRWHRPYLQMLSLDDEKLSPIVPAGRACGRLTPAAADDLGLPASTVVVNGTHDQICAALGAGVLQPGQVLLSCGTAWVILFLANDRDAAIPVAEGVEPYPAPDTCTSDRWAAMVSLYGLGLAPRWYLELLQTGAYPEKVSPEVLYAVMNAGAAASPPGANGLVFSPLAGGCAGCGGLIYLGPQHTSGDVSRAIMEGALFETRLQLESIRASGFPLAEFRMVGGAAESPVWPQIAADIFGAPVAVLDGQTAAARGAAILAGVGAGLFPDLACAVDTLAAAQRFVEPNASATGQYTALYERYVKTVKYLRALG